jgi:hypothetical protein
VILVHRLDCICTRIAASLVPLSPISRRCALSYELHILCQPWIVTVCYVTDLVCSCAQQLVDLHWAGCTAASIHDQHQAARVYRADCYYDRRQRHCFGTVKLMSSFSCIMSCHMQQAMACYATIEASESLAAIFKIYTCCSNYERKLHNGQQHAYSIVKSQRNFKNSRVMPSLQH